MPHGFIVKAAGHDVMGTWWGGLQQKIVKFGINDNVNTVRLIQPFEQCVICEEDRLRFDIYLTC